MDAIRVPLESHSATNIIKEEFQAQISLILDDLVVKNHTSSHDVNETFLVPKTSGTTKNGKLSLQSTKTSFFSFSSGERRYCRPIT
jgi:hypothetical protein